MHLLSLVTGHCMESSTVDTVPLFLLGSLGLRIKYTIATSTMQGLLRRFSCIYILYGQSHAQKHSLSTITLC